MHILLNMLCHPTMMNECKWAVVTAIRHAVQEQKRSLDNIERRIGKIDTAIQPPLTIRLFRDPDPDGRFLE